MPTHARALATALALLLCSAQARAFTLAFSDADFALTPVHSPAAGFAFSVEVDAPLAPGVYANPPLLRVDYRVRGSLAPGTPSGFPAFDLLRSIPGGEFYAQGSSLAFEISALADLADGLQADELIPSGGAIFVLDAREVGTGRYHPPHFQLDDDGTGSIRNANNRGGINPVTQQVVDVDFGDEYVTALEFTPRALVLAVPGPGAPGLLAAAGLAILALRRSARGALPGRRPRQ